MPHEHQLIECLKYPSEGQQKWKIYITASALLMMQVHAHLLSHEVIGFFGGYKLTQDKTRRQTILITETYPGDALMNDENSSEVRRDLERNVELKPESAQEIIQLIEKRHQKCLGWYHSHPTFQPIPSQIDIENHNNYQKHFTKEGMPYLGLIVSPFFRVLPPQNKSKREEPKQVKSKLTKDFPQEDNSLQGNPFSSLSESNSDSMQSLAFSSSSLSSNDHSNMLEMKGKYMVTFTQELKNILQLKCFHLEGTEQQYDPYELEINILQEKLISKRILESIYTTFESYIRNKNLVRNFISYKEPFKKSASLVLNSNPKPIIPGINTIIQPLIGKCQPPNGSKLLSKGEKFKKVIGDLLHHNKYLVENNDVRWRDFGSKFKGKIERDGSVVSTFLQQYLCEKENSPNQSEVMVDISSQAEIKRFVRKIEDLIKWSQEAKKQQKMKIQQGINSSNEEVEENNESDSDEQLSDKEETTTRVSRSKSVAKETQKELQKHQSVQQEKLPPLPFDDSDYVSSLSEPSSSSPSQSEQEKFTSKPFQITKLSSPSSQSSLSNRQSPTQTIGVMNNHLSSSDGEKTSSSNQSNSVLDFQRHIQSPMLPAIPVIKIVQQKKYNKKSSNKASSIKKKGIEKESVTKKKKPSVFKKVFKPSQQSKPRQNTFQIQRAESQELTPDAPKEANQPLQQQCNIIEVIRPYTAINTPQKMKTHEFDPGSIECLNEEYDVMDLPSASCNHIYTGKTTEHNSMVTVTEDSMNASHYQQCLPGEEELKRQQSLTIAKQLLNSIISRSLKNEQKSPSEGTQPSARKNDMLLFTAS
ncbi:hypothetical protein FGO68_gene14830 [Halteria grandinella]|uniref:MPN domain-containing protein n=1 Tax=Halteria grandinella TaxID=5974 RepID=A0A8J8P0W2_HALGN|nr:hypothetical protein FGO68_gene14830 [Halteria grandinella]